MINCDSVTKGIMSKSIHKAESHTQEQGQPSVFAKISLHSLVKVDLRNFLNRSQQSGEE